MKTFIIAITVFFTTIIAQAQSFVVCETSTKLPSVFVYGTIKNENGRYTFPAKLEEKISIKDEYANSYSKLRFQQNVQSILDADTSLLEEGTISENKNKSSVVIVFDASPAAMNASGNKMRELAVRIIRLIDFEYGDEVAFIKAGSTPERIHTDGFLFATDTADLIAYIMDSLNASSSFDFVNAFWGKEKSMFGEKPTLNNVGIYNNMSYPDNQRLAYCITGTSEMSNPPKSESQSSSVSDACESFGVRMYTTFFHDGAEPNTSKEVGPDSLMKWYQFYQMYKNNSNWAEMFDLTASMTQEQQDSVHALAFDRFQRKCFRHRFGIIETQPDPTTIAAKIDSFSLLFESGYYNFETHVKVKNPDFAKVKLVYDDPKVRLYPNPTQDYVQADTYDNSQQVIIYSAQGISVIEGYANEPISIKHLENGVYYAKIGNSVKKFVVSK